MKRFILPALAATSMLALAACDSTPPAAEATTDAMATDTMAADPMAADPMATDTMAADPMATGTMPADPMASPTPTDTMSPMATETPM